jgi:HK97 family phage prohead protease
MTAKRQTRRAEIRATTSDGKPGVTLHAIRPEVVDDYGSLWMADAFDESLAERLPTLCWAHDWSEPLGPAVGFRTGDEGPEIDFEFSDFDAVPMAKRAHTQVEDGTIRDCSVGFFVLERREPSDDERKRYLGVREVIEKAELDEVSLVLRGAVPGAKVVGVRTGKVGVDAVVELAKRITAGELTQDEAKVALDLLAEGDETSGSEQLDEEQEIGSSEGEGEGDDDGEDDAADIDAEMDAGLDALFGRARQRSTPQRRFPDRMNDDVRTMLRSALLDRYHPGDGQWVWIRDHSDVVVVFDLEGFSSSGTFRAGYSITDDKVLLDKSAKPVVPKTTYVDR